MLEYVERMGGGDFDAGLDRISKELDQAGYDFLPGGQGYKHPDGRIVMTWSTSPLWMQMAGAHSAWRAVLAHDRSVHVSIH